MRIIRFRKCLGWELSGRELARGRNYQVWKLPEVGIIRFGKCPVETSHAGSVLEGETVLEVEINLGRKIVLEGEIALGGKMSQNYICSQLNICYKVYHN